MKLATQIVQSGLNRQEPTGAVSTPVYYSATFRHPGLGQTTGYDYSRTSNPTRKALEDAISRLEGGVAALAFSSGMAAIHTVLLLFKPGDNIVVGDDIYGGTYRLMTTVATNLGLSVTFAQAEDSSALAAAVGPSTKAIFVESLTNPLMKVVDLRRLVLLAREHKVLTVVDSTFLTPYFQRPLEFGVDIVIHSATKYLGGHNDVLAGLVATCRADLAERLAFLQNAVGAVLGPQDCWLLLRGLKTLALRLDRQQENALYLSEYLACHPKVKRVYFPGLPQHPGHEILCNQADGYGGVLSFDVAFPELVEQILSRLQLVSFAESLGGVESLITFPARQTHCDIPTDVRQSLGIGDSLLRLSVGIEDKEDLAADLEQALA